MPKYAKSNDLTKNNLKLSLNVKEKFPSTTKERGSVLLTSLLPDMPLTNILITILIRKQIRCYITNDKNTTSNYSDRYIGSVWRHTYFG